VHFVGQGDKWPHLGQLGGQIYQKTSRTFLGVFERLWTERRRMTSYKDDVIVVRYALAAGQGPGLSQRER